MSTHDEVVIQCLCGKLKETVQLKNPLPHVRRMCHCNTCRHITGALTFTGIPLEGGHSKNFASKLVKYETSKSVFRYFCSTCGSHAMYFEPDQDLWSVCSGNVDVVKRGKENALEQVISHIFLKDTVDQGLSICLPYVPCYLNSDDEPPMEDVNAELANAQVNYVVSTNDDKLLAQCHCGQVKLYIDRPDNGGKWKGDICVCRSCRLALGQTFFAFLANVPFAKVTWGDGKTFDDSAHSSITRYQSSARAHRDFCSKCGASVLWSGNQPPGTIDLAAGLLRAKDGARARSWLDWNTQNFEFLEDAVDRNLVTLFQSNLGKLAET